MKKSFIPSLLVLLIPFLFMAFAKRMESAGAPIGSTGAPSEFTCAKSGCHDDFGNLNSGNASLTIETPTRTIESLNMGDTVLVVVSIEDDSAKRFGFSMTILDSEGKSCGQFILYEPNRTQVMKGYATFSNRDYVTYTHSGTFPYQNGKGVWSFFWVRPNNMKNNFVDVYLAAVAANNDGTDKGDEVYTHHERWVFEKNSSNEKISLIQNGSNLILKSNDLKSETKIHVFNILGRLMFTNVLPNAIESEAIISLSALPNGQYIIVLENEKFIKTEKILLSK